jgi:tRNA(fMet)-specific endonuclease VapC
LKRLLDTNVCIHIIRRRPPEVLSNLERFEVGEVGVSSVTVAELSYGAEKSSRPGQNREALWRFLLPLEIISPSDRKPPQPTGGSGQPSRGLARPLDR